MTLATVPLVRRPARPAFTLVELMISIALVVLLILGVNQVFLYTSQAVGTGQAINESIRNGRSVNQTMGADLAAAVPNGLDPNSSAALVIASSSVYAFRNAADLAASRMGNPSLIDLDGDGNEGDSPGETISPAAYGTRNFRTDTLSFFARGKYPRQTGGLGATGAFVANMSSDEAWVWYGLLQLPDNASPAAYQSPGAGAPATNPNNVFATQFVLGRQAVLLQPQLAVTAAGGFHAVTATTPIYASGTNTAPQGFTPLSTYTTTPVNDPQWPFSTGLTSADGYTMPQARYDLAAGTIPMLQLNLATWLQRYPGTAQNWWTAAYYNHSFHCNPFVPKPLTPAAMAQALPYFVKGCTQFTVEFAGDFVTQNNRSDLTTYAGVANPITPYKISPTDGAYGDVITRGSDGVLDFFVDKSADTNPPVNPGLWVRRIRWYGMPRDDNGDGVVSGWGGVTNSSTAQTVTNNVMPAASGVRGLPDVVPVRDVVGTTCHPELLPSSYNGESFEHFPSPDQTSAVGTGNPLVKSVANYANVAAYNNNPANPNTMAYTAAFGPFDPRVKLVRVTITLDDPTGRLRDGQTYQYVFPVGAK